MGNFLWFLLYILYKMLEGLVNVIEVYSILFDSKLHIVASIW